MSGKPRYQRVMLLQPNYSWFGRRSWHIVPYSLGLMNAALKRASYDSWIFDANFSNTSEDELRTELLAKRPDVVGIGSASTEYLEETRRTCAIVKAALPNTLVVLGGVIPTVMVETAVAIPGVDHCIIQEGEFRLPKLLDRLNSGSRDFSGLDGITHGNPPGDSAGLRLY